MDELPAPGVYTHMVDIGAVAFEENQISGLKLAFFHRCAQTILG